MIVFGAAMTDAEAYRRYALPGVELAAESDSEIYAISAAGTVCRSCNLLLELAAPHEGLEALVIVQQETEITDPQLCSKVRATLADPDVAVAGPIGARDVRSLAWWEGTISSAPITLQYNEEGGGELPAFSWADLQPAPAPVEVLDGMLLVLSPWAVRTLRFDEELTLGLGYDLDFCLQARDAGRKVTTVDTQVTRHHPLEMIKELDLWIEGHIQLAEKWEGRDPGLGKADDHWRSRARRAEAERELARTLAYSTAHRADAELLPYERELADATEALSWKATAPLRHANRWQSVMRSRLRGRDPVER